MIWIEHDMQMVADLADRIHVLNYGRTLASGTPADVLADHRVIAAISAAARRFESSPVSPGQSSSPVRVQRPKGREIEAGRSGENLSAGGTRENDAVDSLKYGAQGQN